MVDNTRLKGEGGQRGERTREKGKSWPGGLMLKHNGHQSSKAVNVFFVLLFSPPYTSATCITINLMATLRSLISDGPLSHHPLEQWPPLCPSTSPQSTIQTTVASRAANLWCQGTVPRHSRTRQCVVPRSVCILLPVRVTTSELCGLTLVAMSVIRGPQARCSIAAEDYVRHYNV